MNRVFRSAVAMVLSSLVVSCVAMPEQALSELEDAYRANDIEAAVAAKDFAASARLMLAKFSPEFAENADLVMETAEIIEHAYREEILKSGFPDSGQNDCSVIAKESLAENLVVLEEKCAAMDGELSRQKTLVSFVGESWKVVGPYE